jgi:sugar transferase (PEP-CTERM/EpsH1 system associated)
MLADNRPLVVHLGYRFATGGLENGVVNLINHMPAEAYRHAIVSLTDVTEFHKRIRRADVEFISLHKPPGHALLIYPQLFRLFRRLRPAIVHTRNFAALEAVAPAWAAGVPIRIHGEHGGDIDFGNVTHQRVRRLYRPFVNHYVALSRDLANYLAGKIHVQSAKVSQIYNGVDSTLFKPLNADSRVGAGYPFNVSGHWVVGTVGRMQPVKDQVTLARAFVRALQVAPLLRPRLRLVMVGDGPLLAPSRTILEDAGVADLAWLPGERSDVAAIMQMLQCFVLPSLAEGTSNTILEAMSSGLPVIATDVGANADLVVHGKTGEVVPPADPEAIANCIVRFATSPEAASEMGRAGRIESEKRFTMQAMVASYRGLYDQLLASRKHVDKH